MSQSGCHVHLLEGPRVKQKVPTACPERKHGNWVQGANTFVTAMFCQAHEELLEAHILCKLESAAREHQGPGTALEPPAWSPGRRQGLHAQDCVSRASGHQPALGQQGVSAASPLCSVGDGSLPPQSSSFTGPGLLSGLLTAESHVPRRVPGTDPVPAPVPKAQGDK